MINMRHEKLIKFKNMKNFLADNGLVENIFLKKSFILEDEVFLDNKLIKFYLNKFRVDVMENLDKDQVVLFLFRVRLGEENDPTKPGRYITIGKLFKINNSKVDFNRLYEHLKALLDIQNEENTNLPVLEIIFDYKIIPVTNSKIDKKSTIKKSVKKSHSMIKTRKNTKNSSH